MDLFGPLDVPSELSTSFLPSRSCVFFSPVLLIGFIHSSPTPTMSGPLRIRLKVSPPAPPTVKQEAVTPGDPASESDASFIVPKVRPKAHRPKSRTPKHKSTESSSAEADPVDNTSRPKQDRVLSESEISVLDIGPSLADQTCKPLRVEDLESEAITSDSTSTANKKPLSHRKRRQNEVHPTAPAAGLSPSPPIQEPVPRYGDPHNFGYGYGYNYGVARFPPGGMFRISSSDRSRSRSPRPTFDVVDASSYRVRHYHRGTEPNGMTVTDEELWRYEQSLELFPDVVLDEPEIGRDGI